MEIKGPTDGCQNLPWHSAFGHMDLQKRMAVHEAKRMDTEGWSGLAKHRYVKSKPSLRQHTVSVWSVSWRHAYRQMGLYSSKQQR
jgi:hypothetical protein